MIEKEDLILLGILGIMFFAVWAYIHPEPCHASPLVGVHFNQFRPTDPVPTGIDVAFIQTNNSPAGIDWHKVVKKSGAKMVILNAEGIDRNQLLTGWGDPSKATILNEKKKYAPSKADYSFVYYEFPVYTMPPSDSDIAYSMLKMPIYLLYRTFLKQQIIETMLPRPAKQIAGGFLEIGADDLENIKTQQVVKWIDYVASRHRTPVLLLPPGSSGPYVHNVISDLLYLRDNSRYFNSCIVLFAVYNRDITGIDFKRIQTAVTIFNGNFK